MKYAYKIEWVYCNTSFVTLTDDLKSAYALMQVFACNNNVATATMYDVETSFIVSSF